MEDASRKSDLLALIYPHRCGSEKIRCCEMFRCETCHLEHLRTHHSESMLSAYKYIAQLEMLIKPGAAVKDPPVKKEKKEKKVISQPVTPIQTLSLDQLRELSDLLKGKIP